MDLFNADLSKGKAYFKSFSGANTKQIQHYILPTFIDDQQDSATIHLGTNNVFHEVERARDRRWLQRRRSK